MHRTKINQRHVSYHNGCGRSPHFWQSPFPDMASLPRAPLCAAAPSALRGLLRNAPLQGGAQHATMSTTATLVELREDRLHPGATDAWLAAFARTPAAAAAAAALPSPLRSVTLPDVGGVLDVATAAYCWGGHEERDAHRAAAASDPADRALAAGGWAAERRAQLFVEAPLVRRFGLHGFAAAASPGSGTREGAGAGTGAAIYEVRRYQLRLGYTTVPRWLELYAGGLPSKLEAPGTDPSSSLVTVLYAEVGALNEVIELWRHGGGTAAMDASRQAARGAEPWRAAIASIAELAVSFTSTIHKPAPCSPWQ